MLEGKFGADFFAPFQPWCFLLAICGYTEYTIYICYTFPFGDDKFNDTYESHTYKETILMRPLNVQFN